MPSMTPIHNVPVCDIRSQLQLNSTMWEQHLTGHHHNNHIRFTMNVELKLRLRQHAYQSNRQTFVAFAFHLNGLVVKPFSLAITRLRVISLSALLKNIF